MSYHKYKEVQCRKPECTQVFTKYRSTQKYCEEHAKEEAYEKAKQKREKQKTSGNKPKTSSIPKYSENRLKEMKKYAELRVDYLSKPENEKCFIDGCNRRANTIEHRRGRKGFADEWARDNKISLYIDVRFFAPCCLEHNQELENNPELSRKYQLSKIHGGKKTSK